MTFMAVRPLFRPPLAQTPPIVPSPNLYPFGGVPQHDPLARNHSRAIRSASTIWLRVIFTFTSSRVVRAGSYPLEAARVNHM